MALVTLEEAKAYLRVDTADEDSLIQSLLESSEKLAMDVARLPDEEVQEHAELMKTAVLFTLGYLYEHREEADHHELVMTLRNLLFLNPGREASDHMNIAKLHKRILFQVNAIATDRYGNHTSGWKDYFSTWATIGTDSYGSEDKGVVINPEETLNFTTRWCTELAAVESTKYRILCEGKTYNIIFVNPMGYKHKSLKFTGKLYREKS